MSLLLDSIKINELIEDEDDLCYDVAAEHGQLFDNVKHMKWYRQALLEAYNEKGA